MESPSRTKTEAEVSPKFDYGMVRTMLEYVRMRYMDHYTVLPKSKSFVFLRDTNPLGDRAVVNACLEYNLGLIAERINMCCISTNDGKRTTGYVATNLHNCDTPGIFDRRSQSMTFSRDNVIVFPVGTLDELHSVDARFIANFDIVPIAELTVAYFDEWYKQYSSIVPIAPIITSGRTRRAVPTMKPAAPEEPVEILQHGQFLWNRPLNAVGISDP